MGAHDGKVPLRTTLDDNILICQPYNDEEIVQEYIRKEIIDFQWGSLPASNSDTDETSKPTTEPLWRKRHLLMKDEKTLAALFETSLSDDDDDDDESVAGKEGAKQTDDNETTKKKKKRGKSKAAKKRDQQQQALLMAALAKDPVAMAAHRNDPNRKGSRAWSK